MASRSKVSDSTLSTLMVDVQGSMNERHAGTYRRIWVQYTRIGKERVDVMFTLFPLVGTYRMVFFRGLDVSKITVNSLLGLVSG